MRYSLIAIFFAILFLAVFMLYLFFNEDEEKSRSRALDYFIKGNYEQAEEALKRGQKEMDPIQYYLHSAYLAREKNQLDVSNQDLKKAAGMAEKNPKNKGILFEIYLNQAFNAYLLGSPQGMETPLAAAQALMGNNEWLNFFSALHDSLLGSHKKPLKVPTTPISLWMKKMEESFFTPTWLKTEQMLAKIAEGNIVEVRQQLEQESQNANEKQLEEINLLLGLSYIKEGSEKNVSVATPYYQLAFSYFERIPIQSERYKIYRNEILKQLELQINGMIDANLYADLPFYIKILENWHANTTLEKMKGRLLFKLNKQAAESNWQAVYGILAALNPIMKEKDAREKIQQRFENLIMEALAEGNTPSLPSLWKATLPFSSDEKKFTQKIAGQTAIDIFDLIPLDNSDLVLTKPYIEFWNQLIKDPMQRLLFAETLIDIAEKLFEMENQREKSLRLISIAYAFPDEKGQQILKGNLEHIFKQVYASTLEADNTDLLKFLITAKEQLRLESLNLHVKEDVEKQLNASLDLFKMRKWTKAMQKAQWVLILEPNNQVALRLKGLIDFQNSNYEGALTSLKALKQQDGQTEMALAISEAIAGDRSHGFALLDKLSQQHLFNSDIYLRLGFGLLERGQPELSLKWFRLIEPPNDETLAGEAYAQYLMGNWQAALDLYHRLPDTFQQMEGMRGMAFNALLALGRNQETEALLNEILSSGSLKSTGLAIYSSPFQAFKTSILDLQTPNLIVGTYYKDVKKDNQKALDYLEQVLPATPQALLEMGEIFFQQKNYAGAIDLLKKALDESQGHFQNQQIREFALPFLADSLIQLGNELAAIEAYSSYFAAYPKEIKHRASYARLLMKIRRYDLALEQFKILDSAHALTSGDKIDFLACLLHTGQFQKAQTKATQWINAQPPLSLSDQLLIAQWMTLVGDRSMVQRILDKLPPPEQQGLDIQMALINLWITLGNYEQADRLAKVIQPELEKSFQGLLLLTKLNDRLSKVPEALKFALQAEQMEPHHPEINEIWEIEEADLKTLQEKIDQVRRKFEKDPTNLSLRLDLADALSDRVVALYRLDSTQLPQNNTELRGTYVELTKIAEQVPNLPRLYFLIGKLGYLLDEPKDAQEALQKAIHLDPSYLEAYLYLAMLYFSQKDGGKAIDTLQAGVRFAPQDPDLWLEMALIYSKLDDSLDALTALERAIQYKPNDPKAYLLMAQIKLDLNNPEGAKTALEKILKENPHQIEALRLMLRVLYDPFLTENIDTTEVKRQQEKIYQTLHSLEPKKAELLLNQLRKNR
jgi:tetratricopeptide (TPR) repeat protein